MNDHPPPLTVQHRIRNIILSAELGAVTTRHNTIVEADDEFLIVKALRDAEVEIKISAPETDSLRVDVGMYLTMKKIKSWSVMKEVRGAFASSDSINSRKMLTNVVQYFGFRS